MSQKINKATPSFQCKHLPVLRIQVQKPQILTGPSKDAQQYAKPTMKPHNPFKIHVLKARDGNHGTFKIIWMLDSLHLKSRGP